MTEGEPKQVANQKDSLDNADGSTESSNLGRLTAVDVGVPGIATAGAGAGAATTYEVDQVEEDADDDEDDDTETDTLGNDSRSASAATEEEKDKDKDGKDKDDKDKIRKTPRTKRIKNPETTSLFVRSGYFFLLHVICLAIYLIPILSTSQYNKGEPVLDELHITQESNRDVNGETTLFTIFTNDYWGRPMQSASRYVYSFLLASVIPPIWYSSTD
jgi:hypothetical protein